MAGLLQVEHLTLPNPDDHGKPAFIIRNVFSSEECAEMLRRTEEIGYVPALVNVGGGREMLMMVTVTMQIVSNSFSNLSPTGCAQQSPLHH